MNVQEKPLGIKIILVLNVIAIILAATGCIIVIVRYNLSAYPGATDAYVGQMLGSIVGFALLPGVIIHSVLKRRYSPTMICTVLLVLASPTMPLYILIWIPTLTILCCNIAVKKYLNKEEHKKENNQH